MESPLPDLKVVTLRTVYPERSGRLDLFLDGDDVRLQDAVGPGPAVLDLYGLDYLGYSFAKHTVVPLLQDTNRVGGIVALGPDDEGFLDGLVDALKHGKVALCLAPSLDAVGRGGRAIGAVTLALQETFAVLVQHGPLGTGELAMHLDTSPQNAKNRVDRLEELGLASRAKVSSQSGGKEWMNAAVLAGHRTGSANLDNG